MAENSSDKNLQTEADNREHEVDPKNVCLDELELQIRAQLKKLTIDAKQCCEIAATLLKRAEPFESVRDALGTVVRDENLQVQTLYSEHGQVAHKRIARIQHVNANLRRDVELRQEAVDAQQQAWQNTQQTTCAAADRWSRAVNERRVDMQQQLSDLHEWLSLAESRWLAPQPTKIDDV